MKLILNCPRAHAITYTNHALSWKGIYLVDNFLSTFLTTRMGDIDSLIYHTTKLVQRSITKIDQSDYSNQFTPLLVQYTPNANMADHSVVARDES